MAPHVDGMHRCPRGEQRRGAVPGPRLAGTRVEAHDGPGTVGPTLARPLPPEVVEAQPSDGGPAVGDQRGATTVIGTPRRDRRKRWWPEAGEIVVHRAGDDPPGANDRAGLAGAGDGVDEVGALDPSSWATAPTTGPATGAPGGPPAAPTACHASDGVSGRPSPSTRRSPTVGPADHVEGVATCRAGGDVGAGGQQGRVGREARGTPRNGPSLQVEVGLGKGETDTPAAARRRRPLLVARRRA